MAAGSAFARTPAPGSGAIAFRIPSGRLADVLRMISQKSGVQIVTSVAPDLRSRHAVNRRLTVEQALAQVTQGLPVEVRRMPGGFVVMQARAPAERTPEPVSPLSPSLPPETESPPILVTGYRESLRQAAATKQGARSILEVTRAEDIAAFPDHNAADALQRLPGIAVSRDNGEGRQVSLRGLGPLFTRTALNGMETLATTASGLDNRGSVNRQRRFDYSIFDAGLFSEVEVLKAWSADRDAGGVGGTVALRTVRPLDQPGPVTLISVQGRAGANSRGVTPQMTAELSRRNDSWGVLIAASWSRNRVTEYGYRNWDWVPVVFGEANVGPGVGAEDRARLTGAEKPVYMSRAQTYSTWANSFQRLNLVGAIEHESDTGLRIALDMLYARLANDRQEYSLAAAGTNGLTADVTGRQRLDRVTIAGDTIAAAEFRGVDFRSESKHTVDHTAFAQAVLSLEAPLDDATTISARLGYARSDFEEPVFDKVFLQAKGKSFSYTATGSATRNRYGFDTADRAQWSLMRADTREDAILNQNAGARLEVARVLAPGATLKLGGIYRYFGNDGYERRVRVDYPFGSELAAATTLLRGKTLAPYVVADVDGTFAATGQNRVLSGTDDMPGTRYAVHEDSYAAFALATYDTQLGPWPLKAEIGLQYQRVDTLSSGKASTDASQYLVSQRSHRDAWLPSFQARAALRPDLLLRLAASRNLNQPDVADLRAAAQVNATPFGGTITSGNPALKPFTADALDLSLERYWGGDGYASLGLFYKHLDSFITSQTSVMPYAQTGYPLEFLYADQDGSILYNVIQPVNGSGASIFGIEAAIQRDLRFLPAPLDGFGLAANVTFASGRSEVTYDSDTFRLPLIDLSRWSGNTTLYYTGHGWDARVAAAYRGTYRVGIGNNGNIGEWVKSSLTLDFAAHLAIGARMQVLFEGRNLTDSPVVQYTDRSARRLLARTRSGRVFSAGLRYRF
ncbi:MAG: TonB-dependent receptor [Novosphingobium sp.]|nr:TonB-dependent receptor [Novosphingobium sp.]